MFSFIIYVRVYRVCHNGRHPLQGRTIVADVYAVPPFLHISQDGTGINGIVVDMFRTIARHYGAIPKVTLSDSAFWFNVDGTIGGSAGKVIK